MFASNTAKTDFSTFLHVENVVPHMHLGVPNVSSTYLGAKQRLHTQGNATSDFFEKKDKFENFNF